MPSDVALDGYPAVQEYLFSMKAQGVRFGVDRMRLFAERIGHPERSLPLIHVAGTNGKGSVSSMIETILRLSGKKTGLYTSPHLVRLGERVQVNRNSLTEEEIIGYCRELKPKAEAQAAAGIADDHPSFFEYMTAMAFLQFSRQGCEVGVIEVGLGGRLDATNIITPEVSIITSIGLDHCEMLGETLEKIAAEKAGIIKPGVPVVIGRMPPEAERVIREIAEKNGSVVQSVLEVFGDRIDAYPMTNLEGDYQRWNAATAVLAIHALPTRLRPAPNLVDSALRQVSWPGRWERTRIDGRLMMLDASHNPEGASVLETNLKALIAETGRKPVVVTGALGAVRAVALLDVVARYAKEIHLIVPKQARACSYEELDRLIPKNFSGAVVHDEIGNIFPGPDRCSVGQLDDVIVVTGSIYLLGEVLTVLRPEYGHGEGRLQDF